MILIRDYMNGHTVMTMPSCCSECALCDTYCLLLIKTFKGINPNEERMKDCPLIDVYVDEDGILHPVR